MSVDNPVNASVAVADTRELLFDFERLQVYQVAIQFDGQVHAALPRRGHRELRQQLERSSLSVVANIAEGAGRTAPKDKRRFYAIARGSATESAALLDVLLARKLVTAETHQLARTSLLRIVQMLTRLCVERR